MTKERIGMEVSDGTQVGRAKPSQLLYSSEFLSPKVFSILTGSLTTDSSGNASIDIPHSLLYAPAVFAYIHFPDGWYAVDNFTTRAETSRINVTLRYFNLTPSTGYPFKVWVFSDPAQELSQ